MKHFATAEFGYHYRRLPDEVRGLADKNFALLRDNSAHPSLRLRKIAGGWSVRVGLRFRALAIERDGNLHWFWIGPHHEYDQLIKSPRKNI
jgi:hypothetical protein